MILAFLLSFLTACASAAKSPTVAYVIVPVASVWSKTATDPALLKEADRETELLLGEKVIVHEVQGEWARIEAVEQPEYTHHQTWEGYPGWVLKNTLGPVGVRPDSPRQDPVAFAKTFLGTAYGWGGMSKQGIDCSGLTHLAYRMARQVIPRDAHEQWMKARAIEPTELQPGDLIFSGKSGKIVKVSHVTLYAGDGKILEAPQTGMVVREISFQDKYGQPLKGLHNGSIVGERVLFFGTYRRPHA